MVGSMWHEYSTYFINQPTLNNQTLLCQLEILGLRRKSLMISDHFLPWDSSLVGMYIYIYIELYSYTCLSHIFANHLHFKQLKIKDMGTPNPSRTLKKCPACPPYRSEPKEFSRQFICLMHRTM